MKKIGDGNDATYEAGDWERTSHSYYDGQRMIEERDNNGHVLKQYACIDRDSHLVCAPVIGDCP